MANNNKKIGDILTNATKMKAILNDIETQLNFLQEPLAIDYPDEERLVHYLNILAWLEEPINNFQEVYASTLNISSAKTQKA